MARLYRPHVPITVKIAVAERQVTELSRLAAPARPGWARLLWLLDVIARKTGCEIAELRLDHDPALAARPLMHKRKTGTIVYKPDANDPDHLFYRPHGPQHAGSHLVKTNVRGDHGQHPDRVLIKKARRLEQSRNCETPRKASRFPKVAARVKHSAGFGRQKTKWASRPFPKRSSP